MTEERERLEKASRELAATWLKFQDVLPHDQKRKVDNSPPCINDVFQAVDIAEHKRKGKRNDTRVGGLKSRFGKLCRNLVGHENLFAVIPSGDKYISILSGSLSAIIKVTVFRYY